MQKLNLPEFDHRIKNSEGSLYIFDAFRKKHVRLTPEEWVRQNFAHYLINKLGYPKSLIQTEYSIKLNNLTKRADILASDRMGQPLLIVECKAPNIKIDQKAFDQIAVYNMKLKVEILVVTNGLKHYSCRIDSVNKSYEFLEEIPEYEGPSTSSGNV